MDVCLWGYRSTAVAVPEQSSQDHVCILPEMSGILDTRILTALDINSFKRLTGELGGMILISLLKRQLFHKIL